MPDQIEFMSTKKQLRASWFLEQPRRTYLELGLTFVTIAFFAIFALKPTLVTISQLISKEQNLQESDAKLKTKITNLQKAQELLNNATPQLNLIEESLPPSPDVPYFMSTLESLASEGHVRIVSITMEDVPVGNTIQPAKPETAAAKGKKTAAPAWKEIPFTVIAEGRYDDLRAFVIALGNLRRPIINPSLTISVPQDEHVTSGVLTAAVKAGLPYLPQHEQTKK